MIYKPVQTSLVHVLMPADWMERYHARIRERVAPISEIFCVGRRFYATVGEPKRRTGPWTITKHTPTGARFKSEYETASKRGFTWFQFREMLNKNKFYFTNSTTTAKRKSQ